MFNGVSLLIVLLLGVAIVLGLYCLLGLIRVMLIRRSNQRKLDLLESSLNPLGADDFYGPRPW